MRKEPSEEEMRLYGEYKLLRGIADRERRRLNGEERQRLMYLERRLGLAPPALSMPMLMRGGLAA